MHLAQHSSTPPGARRGRVVRYCGAWIVGVEFRTCGNSRNTVEPSFPSLACVTDFTRSRCFVTRCETVWHRKATCSSASHDKSCITLHTTQWHGIAWRYCSILAQYLRLEVARKQFVRPSYCVCSHWSDAWRNGSLRKLMQFDRPTHRHARGKARKTDLDELFRIQ